MGTWDDGDLPPPGPAPVDVPGARGLAELSASSPANSGPVVSSSSERGQRGDVRHNHLHVGQGRVGGSGTCGFKTIEIILFSFIISKEIIPAIHFCQHSSTHSNIALPRKSHHQLILLLVLLVRGANSGGSSNFFSSPIFFRPRSALLIRELPIPSPGS